MQTARAGRYPEGIAAEIAPDHLSKYFTKEDHVFVVRKDIREMMTFAKQDMVGHPPFTQVDVLCCRNLLIYLEPRMQQQILRLFHHALKPNGLLFLGMSETTSSCPDLFMAIDQKWKVFRRRHAPATAYAMSREVPKAYLGSVQDRSGAMRPQKAGPVAEDFPRLLLQQHLPPSVIINQQGEIFYIHGQTGAYLEPAMGEPTLHPNLFTMIREGLKLDLLSSVRKAASQDAPIMLKGRTVKTNGLIRRVDVTVRRMREPDQERGLLMITFTSAGGTPSREQPPRERPPGKRKREKPSTLERQLQTTKEQLHNAFHDLGVAKEELTATNEEWASTVEELQSTNEELEASREELQSLNEELTTVNAELQSKMEQLSDNSNDMLNLLNSQDVAILFLDKTLRIKRFTPPIQLLIHLTKGDIGRPINDFTTQFTSEHLAEDAAEVLRTLAPKEREVAAQDGHSYTLRITPYQRDETQIDGLVLTFTDVSRLKRAEQQITEAQAFAESIVATVRHPLLVLDGGLRVVSANAAFYRFFQVSPEKIRN
ncbi:MAG: PAS domain-containing protein, partial [Nitrospiraceae bacterium]